MPAVERDPAGLLERIPELGELAEKHAALRSAIEQGKAHRAYRALFWLKWSGKARGQRALIEDLLGRRRLFIQPLTGAPRMVTMNGIGSTIYGSAEHDGQDGTHIKTLFLVILFVPVYPFAAYLVRQNPERTNSWNFFGKVPMSTPLYLWQRAIALAGVVAVAAGALNALGSMRYNTVRVVNALPLDVSVQIAGAALSVPAGQVGSVRCKVGKQPIEVRSGGRVIEASTIDVRRGYDVVAWNVLGAGLLYNAQVIYTAKNQPEREPNRPTLYCGQQNVLLDGINYAFEPPPRELSMSDTEKYVYRSHVDFIKAPPFACVSTLAHDGKPQAAEDLAANLAALSDYELDLTRQAAYFLSQSAGNGRAIELCAAALKSHDDSVEHHRLYQNFMIEAERDSELLSTYRARAAAKPDSADALYLLGRLLHGEEGARFDRDAAARFPKNPYLLRSAAYAAMRHDDPAGAEKLIEELRPLDEKIWLEAVDLELHALAAQSALDRARALVRDALSSVQLEPHTRFEIAVDGLELARFAPAADEQELLGRLVADDDDDTATLRLGARVAAGSAVPAGELAALKDEQARRELELELLAHKDPNAALGRIAQSDAPLGRLSEASTALLLGEAARRDPQHPAVERLMRGFPYGRQVAAALVRYVQSGQMSDLLADANGEILAAAHLVRSRVESLQSEERRALLDRVRHEDVLRGPVTLAAREWTL